MIQQPSMVDVIRGSHREVHDSATVNEYQINELCYPCDIEHGRQWYIRILRLHRYLSIIQSIDLEDCWRYPAKPDMCVYLFIQGNLHFVSCWPAKS